MQLQVFLETEQTGLDEAVKQFLLSRQDEIAPASLWHLYRSLRQHAANLGNPATADITAAAVGTAVADIRSNYSPGTARGVIGDIKQFYAWLHATGRAPVNHGRNLKRPRPPRRKHAADESDALLLIERMSQQLRPLLFRDLFGGLQQDGEWRYADYKRLHDLAAIMMLYESGCRAGELCNISAHHLRRSLAVGTAVYELTAYGKTGDRNYLFTTTTAELCRLWLAIRPFQAAATFVSWRPGQPPTKLNSNALAHMLARRCQQAGIRPFRPHALRHAKVIRSRRAVGLELASRLVDHASIATTRAYDYIESDELAAAAASTGHQGIQW